MKCWIMGESGPRLRMGEGVWRWKARGYMRSDSGMEENSARDWLRRGERMSEVIPCETAVRCVSPVCSSNVRI